MVAIMAATIAALLAATALMLAMATGLLLEALVDWTTDSGKPTESQITEGGHGDIDGAGIQPPWRGRRDDAGRPDGVGPAVDERASPVGDASRGPLPAPQ
jgi:hypothetical protein